MRLLLARIAALVATAALFGCGPIGSADQELIPVRLAMGFIPNIQYSPFYVAAERGYYREAGVEVEFDYSTEIDGVALVGTNEIQFALASGEQVLLARGQSVPVVYVMAWFQEYPIALAAPIESGIDDPGDLAGKKIGIPGLFGASFVGYRALLAAAGLPENAATLDSIGFNQVEAIAAGQEDAVVVYANNEPIQLAARGVEVRVIRVSDFVELASNGLITNEVTLRQKPELVSAMVTATLRGLKDVIADPDAAYEISKLYVEGLAQADEAVQRQVLAASISMWEAPRLGYSNPDAWANMHQVLLDMGLLARGVDVERAHTNQFIPLP